MPPGPHSEQVWLDLARASVLHGEDIAAESTALLALQEHPGSVELRRLLAGIHLRTRREADAESVLRRLLTEHSDDAGSAFALARLLVSQNRSNAAAAVLRACFEHARQAAGVVIQAIELLHACGRERDAAAIVERALQVNPDEPRLHAYAGMLNIQLGEFQRARGHYLFALEHDPRACEWHLPHGLALMQRYADARHPDFARFHAYLERTDISDKARSTLLFALAKAHDDIGDFAHAATYSRQANTLAHKLTQWSRKQWRRAIEASLDIRSTGARTQPQADFVPIFVIGVPRSGTTLVSELLSHHPLVCNRGEPPWLAALAQQPDLIGNPNPARLQRAAATYAAQMRQDDPRARHWYIDKQPLNFRYVDLMLALFPNAKIIHCRRSPRDTALSLWMQSFDEEVQGYAYDFEDIALVMRDCERLMARWRKLHGEAIHEASYEKLVQSPETVIAELTKWLKLPTPIPRVEIKSSTTSTISTASIWQARQPVYLRSAGRWKNYLSYLPELLQFKADGQ